MKRKETDFTKFRKAIQLSQDEFAQFLNTSRSNVALVESNRRSYQSESLHKIVTLFLLMNNSEDDDELLEQAEEKFNDEYKLRLEGIISFCQPKLVKAEIEFKKMKVKFELAVLNHSKLSLQQFSHLKGFTTDDNLFQEMILHRLKVATGSSTLEAIANKKIQIMELKTKLAAAKKALEKLN